jgi:hypothetical protein
MSDRQTKEDLKSGNMASCIAIDVFFLFYNSSFEISAVAGIDVQDHFELDQRVRIVIDSR